MKKVLFTLLTLVALVSFSQAQEKQMAISVGPIVSLPMGDFGDGANTGFGGTGNFELGFTPNIVGVGTIGYITWGTDVDDVSFSSVPVLAGIKYYFTPGQGFYGLGQAGLSFMSVEVPSFNWFTGEVTTESVSETEFTLVLGAGYELPLTETLLLDLTGAFNLVSDANHITLRAGVKFGL